MKKLLLILLCLPFIGFGQAWQYLGNPNFTECSSGYQVMDVYQGVPYIALLDCNNNTEFSVMKFESNNWVYVGDTTLLFDACEDVIDIKVDPSGIPYVAFIDCTNDSPVIKKFDGNSWVNLNSNILAQETEWISFDIDDNGDLFLAYHIQDSASIFIDKYNGSFWQSLGTILGTPGEEPIFKLEISISNNPYLLNLDLLGGDSINFSVYEYDNVSWLPLPQLTIESEIDEEQIISIFCVGYSPWLIIPSEINNNDSLTIYQYNNNLWSSIGGPIIQDLEMFGISTNQIGIPHITYIDDAICDEATASRLVNNNWQNIGNACFQEIDDDFTHLVFSNNTPYSLSDDNGSISVMWLPSATSIKKHTLTENRYLLKITDLLGRETKQTNQPLLYLYDDGTVEKKLIIE